MSARRIFTCMACAIIFSSAMAEESFSEIAARVGQENAVAFEASRFSTLSKDYFARFVRDPSARPKANETAIDSGWSIAVADDAAPVVKLMATHLQTFLRQCMDLELELSAAESLSAPNTISLNAGDMVGYANREQFTITVAEDRIIVNSPSPAGVRDGVVRLVDELGFRKAPYLESGKQTHVPRLAVRLGTVPRGGAMRDLVFLGYNAIFSGGGSLFALSPSDAIPEITDRRQPGTLEGAKAGAANAREYGLKTYAFVDMRQKFPKDHPVFEAHPELRGALTWQADGEYVLCTEHPLMQQWLRETVQAIFKNDPELSGLTLINGGEGFYHCFMRPFGVEKGHTNCERCEAFGAETVVANLCNLLADAACGVSPEAEVIVWPYSAAHVWSADPDQLAFIEKLKPGVVLLTEIEKDEYLEKPDGVRKHLWDYSIDMIGPGERAKRQIAACKAAGINVYLKSEPELGFEAPRLPHIPCMDRWVDRAEALASCGATGAFVFPAFRPNYGTSAAEVAKYMWWNPAPDKDALLDAFATRLFGEEAAPHMREAWKHVSKAIEYSPEIPPYYTGPYYLGPAHPMICDPEAQVPEVFYGYYLFMAEIMDSEGAKSRPTFFTVPRGDRPVFERYYRDMEKELALANDAVEKAGSLVPDDCRLMFDAEVSSVAWFYRTARTHVNFYESCRLRDALAASCAIEEPSEAQRQEAEEQYARWREVLEDDRSNTEAALPLVEADMRLDWYFGGDHVFPHAADMIRAKLELLDGELNDYLPSVAEKCGIEAE